MYLLCRVMVWGNRDVVCELLTRGDVNVNTQDYKKRTALIFASDSHPAIVRVLLSHRDIEPNSVNASRSTALIIAACKNQGEIVEHLVRHPKTRLNQKNFDGWTALMFGCRNGHHNIVSTLLSCSTIEVNQTTNNGWTALMITCRFGHEVHKPKYKLEIYTKRIQIITSVCQHYEKKYWVFFSQCECADVCSVSCMLLSFVCYLRRLLKIFFPVKTLTWTKKVRKIVAH